MAASAKSRSSFYNKNNKLIVKLNDSALAEMMKKQALEEVTHRIDAYLIENNINTSTVRTAQTLLSKDIVI